MGLDCSYDAFHGAYSSFNRFRQAVAKAVGGSFPPHEDKSLDDDAWYWPDGGTGKHPGLAVLLGHSDCDGQITPADCVLLADELEALLPALAAMGMGGGHILSRGGYAGVAQRFIDGCRKAASENVPLEFY